MEEYETRTYVFEDRVLDIEIPNKNYKPETTSPAQTEHSLLVKAVKAEE